MANFENYQTFDPGRFLHSYFEILNAFHFRNPVHFLVSLVSFKYMALERLANAYIVMWSLKTCNMGIQVTLTFRILGHIYYMHNSCLI
jgi:hypothetical protein